MIIKLTKTYANGARHTLYVKLDGDIEAAKARIDREDEIYGDNIPGVWSISAERQ